MIVPDDTSLTLQPGTVVKFSKNAQMLIKGTLLSSGADTAMVVLTSMDDNTYGNTVNGSDGNPEPGDWYGLYCDGAGNQEGRGNFTWSRIRYGGSPFSSHSANIYCFSSDAGYFTNSISEYSGGFGYHANSSVSLIIDSSTIANNGNHGVYVQGAGSPSISNTHFSHNNGYGAYLENVAIASYSGNTGGGNDIDGIGVNGTVQWLVFWSSGSAYFPFILTGTVVVADDRQLVIKPGTVIKALSNGYLVVHGALQVDGMEDSMVVFTSFHDDDYGGDTDGDAGPAAAGDWYGISVNGAGAYNGIAYIDWCRIRYGGSTATGYNANFAFYESSLSYFRTGVSEYSATNGISIVHSSPSISASQMVNNSWGGIAISGSTSHPVLGTETQPGMNTFQNNGSFNLVNTSGNIIQAEMNYWAAAIAEVIGSTIDGDSVDYTPWLGGDASLPIGLTTFDAVLQEGQVHVRWSTLTETNNYGFEVQRRKKGESEFVTVSEFIAGQGTTMESHEYTWQEARPAPGEYYYRLKQVDLDGAVSYSAEIVVVVDGVSAAAEDLGTVKTYALAQNYPNPFNPATNITFAVPQECFVTLSVYDVLGRQVANLVNERRSAGEHSVTWNAEGVPSGVYYYRMAAGAYTEIRRMVVVR